MDVYIVIVHRPCRDGYAAELCARYYYQKNPLDNSLVLYWGADSDKNRCLTQLQKQYATYKEMMEYTSDVRYNVVNIRVFDLAVTPEHLNYLVSVFGDVDIQVYDHHKTFKDVWDEYAETDNMMYQAWEDNLHYDVSRSGAHLAWRYYFPNEPVPLFIQYIEDRDLWAWRMPNAKEVGEALYLEAPRYNNPQEWIERYFIWDGDGEELEYFERLNEMGKVLINNKNRLISALYRTGVNMKLQQPRALNVYSCNAPHNFSSDLGSYAVNITDEETGEYKHDVAFIWRINMATNKIDVSVRSSSDRKDDSVDVTEICKRYGGGGHKHAGGFELPISEIGFLLV